MAEVMTGAIFIAIMILNTLSGIIGWLWLIIGGNWLICLISAILVLGSTKISGIIQMPAHILLLLKLNKNNTLKLDRFFLSALIYSILTSMFCTMLVYYGFTNMVDDNFLIPSALLSYSVSTSVWDYLATRDTNARSFDLSAFSYFLRESGFYIFVAMFNKVISIIFLIYFILFY